MNHDSLFDALEALLENEAAPRADPGAVKDTIICGYEPRTKLLGLLIDVEPTVAGTKLQAFQAELAYTGRSSTTPRKAISSGNAMRGDLIRTYLRMNAPDRRPLEVTWRVSVWVSTGAEGSWWIKEGTLVLP